ncbi:MULTISPECIES: his operon leader peptide [Dickeya]|uniref:his operon leader peptide n=1 Tax=Dickeya undicola TaxID=1577887 RepID=A0A3N0G3H8_9GAMM|nr:MULTISPECIES: his operon leader peptide [Dickeya]MBO8134836.1 his operon leader peptide [Dickeya fangzhongdai]QOH50081.1 his operon leader peptide [Dickeya fangzhongdai]QOH54385.1 his operon leader peptide [Dickeya fangzhongdai]RNM06929.1 his operon leader peptide [Dickeya undicola]RNM24648.1 his operon leader peptide [Dickeya undicola]
MLRVKFNHHHHHHPD